MKKSFTIIEVTVAIFLLTIGVGGAYALIQQTLTFAPVAPDRLTAAYLAQEGIEIVRNIRDTNWLEQRGDPTISWDEDIPLGDWEADYTTTALIDTYDGDFLKIGGGFYNYTSGENTKFQRKITIVDKIDLDGFAGAELIKVRVTVQWTERRRSFAVTAQENLYKWR